MPAKHEVRQKGVKSVVRPQMKAINLPLQKSYPKQIHFSDCVYKILFKKNLKCYGETDAEKKTITIKSGLSPRQTLHTFVHECLHVIEFEHPLKITHAMVYELEKAIVEILLDNFL